MNHRISELEWRLSNIVQRLNNIVRLGNVTQVDYPSARVRVNVGENTTAWLPWMSSRAGRDECSWNPPEVDEQVVVIAPSGELAAGVVLAGGIYKKDRPANGDKATISRTTYADGATCEYDRDSHTYSIAIPNGGKIILDGNGVKITAGETSLNIDSGGIIIKGTITILGSVTQFKGALKSNNVTLHSHIHGGITSGTASSGPPVPL